MIPWQGGKPLTWDVTVVSTLADFFIWRFKRDLVSVPAPLNAHTALQLCLDYGLLLLL